MWSLAYPQVRGALICLLIAVVYIFLWPGRKDPDRFRRLPLWRRMILRWFHALTWVLLAIACLLWSKLIAVVAAVTYVIFLITVRLREPSQ